MFYFGFSSREKLETCHEDLQLLMRVALRTASFDFSILEGYRGSEDQKRYYDEGLSTVMWPDSQHNKVPSQAVHAAPWPVIWPQTGQTPELFAKLTGRFYMLAVHIMRVAKDINVPLRWGGDWDSDWDILDQKFDDLAHYELRDD